MWPWYTAHDRREAATIVLILTVTGACVLLAVPVLVGAGLAAATGSPTTPPPTAGNMPSVTGSVGAWPRLLAGLLGRPGDPAEVFGGTYGPVLFWAITIPAVIAVGIGWVWVARFLFRGLAPMGTGFASRADLARELSVAVCRRRAAVTRPALNRGERRRVPAAQVGIRLHRAAVTGAGLWLPLENATGVVAPQQSGKSLMDLIHKIIDAPGGLLVTSTKLDLFLHTARRRERDGSPVHVLDLTGAARWPRRVRWSPITGCDTVKAAKRRAQALVHATTGTTGGADQVGNHAFFERRATDVLTAYLLAAAVSGATIGEFVAWCQNDTDPTAATVLRGRPEFTAVRRGLQQAQAVVEETRSGIWETLRDAIGCLTDPDLAATALPGPDEPSLDLPALIRGGGTVYVIGSEDDAASQAPLITAFVQDVLDTARRTAIADSARTGRERLDPPFTAVLDELASICPLPDLPDTLSDSAGRGVLIHYALQSPAQAQARWGKAAATLFDNTTALTIFGGLKSEETLKWASLLVGRRLEERRSRQKGRHFTDPGSDQIGTERVDTLEPAAIRQIPRSRALLILRAMPATIVHLQPAWQRPDWPQLQADAHHLRHHGDRTADDPPARDGGQLIDGQRVDDWQTGNDPEHPFRSNRRNRSLTAEQQR